MRKEPTPLLAKLLCLTAMVCASGAASAGTVTHARILRLQIHKQAGSYVFIQVDAPVSLPANCSSSSHWHFTLPLTTPLDEKIYASLLTAYATGAPVWIGGMDACNETPTVESVQAFELSQ